MRIQVSSDHVGDGERGGPRGSPPGNPQEHLKSAVKMSAARRGPRPLVIRKVHKVGILGREVLLFYVWSRALPNLNLAMFFSYSVGL